MSNQFNQTFGQYGGEFVSDTNARNNQNYAAIRFTEESVINTIENVSGIDGTSFGTGRNGKTVPAGHEILGKITQLTLTSGSCDVYNADPEA